MFSFPNTGKTAICLPQHFISFLTSRLNNFFPNITRFKSSQKEDEYNFCPRQSLLRAFCEKDLVLHHSDFPEDLCVPGTSSMYSELDRSTSSDILSHPFSVDPTFSLGKFEVTPVVFKNLLLKAESV